MRDVKSFLLNLSHYPGVYQMVDKAGVVIYVGKAKDLKRRLSSYFTSTHKDPKTMALVKQINDIHVTVTHTENEAVILECNLIKQHRPRYNVLLRDDKSYPYIVISTEHEYPRLDSYRGKRKKDGLYFGPFPSALAVRETINHLQKLFRIRTCRDSYFAARSRPCLLYQIDRCTGPCVDYVSKEAYAQQVRMACLFLEGKSHEIIEELQRKMEEASLRQAYESAADLRDQIIRLRQIQDKQYVDVGAGDADVIGFAMQSAVACIHLLSIRRGQMLGSKAFFPIIPNDAKQDEILSAFVKQHYLGESDISNIPKQIILQAPFQDEVLLEEVLSERAGYSVKFSSSVRGGRKKWLTIAQTSAKQSLATKLFKKSHYIERIEALQQCLGLDSPPSRIECYDISHTQGEATVASCVVFDQGGPLKSAYRRFNIKDIAPGDDVAAMRQVLTRRFKAIEQHMTELPDIVLIDGGAAQLTVAEQVLASLQVPQPFLVGVAKGPLRKAGYESLHTLQAPPKHLPGDSHALHLIQEIRDEAHRFAITGHRLKRDKVRTQSSLEEVQGVGAKRRRDLLRYFGGIQGVAHASLDELMKVPGINKAIAERIFAVFHDTTL